MYTSIICMICGVIKRDLRHHVKMHGMSPDQYREKFPNAPMQCLETKQKMSSGIAASHKNRPPISEVTRRKLSVKSRQYHAENSSNEAYLSRQRAMAAAARSAKGPNYRHSEETKAKMRGERLHTRHVPKSAEHREKLAEARRKIVGWTHREDTIAKMKASWERRKADKETYAEYIRGLSDRAKSPERIAELRHRISVMIQSGNHNGKSRDTKLECRFAEFLNEKALSFSPQYPLSDRTGTFTFDFYVPDLHLLVETDGEYWHRKSHEQINRDMIKERKALSAGYRFLRISDKDWRPEMIFVPDDDMATHNATIIESRLREMADRLR